MPYRPLFSISLLTVAFAFFVVMTFGATTLNAQSLTGHQTTDTQQKVYWIPRCENNEQGTPKNCEIFQRLLVKETGQRVSEFAVGFPDGKGKNARGVAVLPLGILLNEKTGLRVDDGEIFYFQVRYCTQNGCYAFLDLTPQVIADMKRGNEASFYFTTLEGKKLQIDFSLAGFTKALETL